MKKHSSIFWIVNLLLAVGFLAGLTSCASSKKTTASKGTPAVKPYEEDLSVVRPKYGTPPPTRPATAPATRPSTAPEPKRQLPSVQPLHINRRLDALLDTIARQNRAIRYAPGYRIQVYVGDARQKADQAKVYTYQNHPELNPYLSYRQPTYRLKVGDFMRRMDAERYLEILKQQFSSAILLPDRVDIRKSLSIK
ncbi:SPOR domain-containing protein [Tellurirhabdus bombi]|uniref:SPOR domain-containing protein n=1 Tax=Tellurirhabdus bombi TaxID=2907205 RepID=UPI001F332FF6|nr:SPOR domain-containing protein [Tellurirhabdus bombi]